jgi:hypothetical protein
MRPHFKRIANTNAESVEFQSPGLPRSGYPGMDQRSPLSTLKGSHRTIARFGATFCNPFRVGARGASLTQGSGLRRNPGLWSLTLSGSESPVRKRFGELARDLNI